MKPHPTMGDWQKRKRRKAGKQSQTAGKTKGLNCQADGVDRIMCTRNRSHKRKDYAEWSARKRP